METTYHVNIDGERMYSTPHLPMALQEWNARTHYRNDAVGGVEVVTLDGEGNMVRDGWILHVKREGDGTTVYVSSRLGEVTI